MQRLVQSSEFAFRLNGQLFVVLQSQPRVFSLSVIAFTSPLLFNFARWFTTADNSVFTFARSGSRGDDSSVLRPGDRHVPVGGRHRVGRLVQHLVVRCLVCSSPAPLPCLSEDPSFVTSQCSVIVRDFGHPRPSVVTAPVYRGCPCRDPLG